MEMTAMMQIISIVLLHVLQNMHISLNVQLTLKF